MLQTGGSTPPLIRLKKGTLAVLPFSMPQRSYFESGIGARLSRDIAQWVATGCPSAKVVDADKLPPNLVAQGKVNFKVGDVMDDETLVAVGKGLGADYIVVGEVHELRAKDPRSVNVLRGTIVLSVRVADVKRGSIAWAVEREAFTYPPLLAGAEEIPAEEKSEEAVMRKVMLEASQQIATVFTGREATLPERVHRAAE